MKEPPSIPVAYSRFGARAALAITTAFSGMLPVTVPLKVALATSSKSIATSEFGKASGSDTTVLSGKNATNFAGRFVSSVRVTPSNQVMTSRGRLIVAVVIEVNAGCGKSGTPPALGDTPKSVVSGQPALSNQASLASLGIEPVKVRASLNVLFPGWEQYDFQESRIDIDGMMTGNSGGNADMLRVLVNCKIPTPKKAQYWDVPGQWNCTVVSYRPFPGGARSISHDYFGQKPGYYGDFYWPHDKQGNLVPAEERQPRLIDAGTAILFPDISLESPGSMRITCSQPLRDLARSADLEHQFDGCTIAWKNMFVPDETHYEMTIGQEVTIPGLYVAAKPKAP